MSLVLDEHRRYLADRSRVDLYERALREVIRPGDVVADLASGTGILGLLACRAGAARVYAVEIGSIAGLARELAAANGFADRITVIRGHSRDISLPERAAVVVCDQVGRFGFEAGLLPLLSDARARFLTPGGALMPCRLELFLAPVEHPRQAARVRFWERRPNGFDLHPAHRIAINTGYPIRLSPAALLAQPFGALSIDPGLPAVSPLRLDASFPMVRAGTCDGIAGWFAARLSPSVVATNSPLDRHRIARRQAFFPLPARVALAQGDRVDVQMRVLPEDLVVSWTVTMRPRKGEPVSFQHSTLNGMLIDGADVRRTHPGSRPSLNARGVARRTVLELCDGTRTLAQIEAEVFARHADLFASAGEAAVFVGEVVTRYTA